MSNQNSGAGQKLASKANVNTADMAKIAAIGLPMLMGALNKNNQSQEGLESFTHALQDHQSRGQVNSPEEVVEAADPADGDKILGHAFDNKDGIMDRIANALNMEPSTVKKVMALLAPVVLRYLADRHQKNQLNKENVQKETEQANQDVLASLKQQLNSGDAPVDQEKANTSDLGGLLGNLLGSNKGQASDQTAGNEDKGFLSNMFDSLFK